MPDFCQFDAITTLPAGTGNPVAVARLSLDELLREADHTDHPLVRELALYLQDEAHHSQELDATGYDSVKELDEAREVARSDAAHWEKEHDDVEHKYDKYRDDVDRLLTDVLCGMHEISQDSDTPADIRHNLTALCESITGFLGE
jgi:hypothetical protein